MSEQVEQDMYVRITELIGEMGWGIGLPNPMTITYRNPHTSEICVQAVEPENYKQVFEAIYKKLKANPDYNPLEALRKREYRYLEQIDDLLESLTYAIKEADGWYDDSTGKERLDTPEMDKARSLLG